MTFVLDILHFVAAALLAVIGFGYEREEECDPVQFQPAAFVYQTEEGSQAQIFVTSQTGAIEASDCDSSSGSASYPVL